MKTLQLIHTIQNRGAETFACQLSNHLITLGHEVKVVALYNGDAVLPFHGEIVILDERNINKFINFKGWKKLSQIIEEFKPDIIQANSGDTLKYAVFSKFLYRWKQSLVFRNASEVGRYLKSPLQKRFNRFLYKNVDWVISVSEASKKDLISHFSFLKGKVDVIGVGLEPFDHHSARILKPKGRKHIVHVGGFSFEKNHIGLLNIFETVLKKNKNVHLHLVGDGELKTEIERLSEHKKLNKNISFYGFVMDPLTYIKAADVVVLPSIIEGLPGVLLEAMSCKTPVVAYNVGGISEIVTTTTGSLIEKGNEREFSKSVIDILEIPPSDKIDAASHMVQLDFMNKNIAKKFEAVYKNILVN